MKSFVDFLNFTFIVISTELIFKFTSSNSTFRGEYYEGHKIFYGDYLRSAKLCSRQSGL